MLLFPKQAGELGTLETLVLVGVMGLDDESVTYSVWDIVATQSALS